MIHLTLLLFGPLQDQFEKKQMTLEMPENTTVLSLLEHLNLDSTLVKVAVNGQIVSQTMILVEEYEIALIPPVSGG
tara:strand:+ start:1610 stop:1837 length:228 start_codon:yes stop_codon:yes gene_type:complete